jgi:hypothetical protein
MKNIGENSKKMNRKTTKITTTTTNQNLDKSKTKFRQV